MISGLVLKYLNGECFVIRGFYKYTRLALTEFNLTVPAVEMQTMASCERLAAASRGWSAFDWAEHCLKQERRIGEGDVCARYIWRQWQLV